MMRQSSFTKRAITGQLLIVIVAVLVIVAGASAVLYGGGKTSSSTTTITTTSTSVATTYITSSLTSSITTTKVTSTQVTIPALNLTVGGSSTTKVLSAKQIMNLTSFTAAGGFLSSTGSPSSYGSYTGVPLITLCNLVGGLTNKSVVTVTGSNGVSVVYTYQEVLNGQGFTTYSPTTGAVMNATQPLTLLLAYGLNDTALGSAGPLQTVVVGSQGLLTSSSLSVQSVTGIKITTPAATTSSSTSSSASKSTTVTSSTVTTQTSA